MAYFSISLLAYLISSNLETKSKILAGFSHPNTKFLPFFKGWNKKLKVSKKTDDIHQSFLVSSRSFFFNLFVGYGVINEIAQASIF